MSSAKQATKTDHFIHPPQYLLQSKSLINAWQTKMAHQVRVAGYAWNASLFRKRKLSQAKHLLVKYKVKPEITEKHRSRF